MAQIYNPGSDIVQAYISGRQLALQREAEQFRQQQSQQDLQLRQQLADQAAKQFDAQHKLEQQRLDAENASRMAEHNVQGLSLKGQLLDLISRGVMKPAYQQESPEQSQTGSVENAMNVGQPGATPNSPQFAPINVLPAVSSGGLNFPSLNISPSEISTPAERGQATAELQAPELAAQAKSKIDIAKALAPIETSGKIAVENAKQANLVTLQKQKDTAALQRTQASVEGQKAAASIRANATLEAAKIKSQNNKATTLDPEQVGNDAVLAATGHIALTGFTPSARATRKALTTQDYVPFDPKQADKLKSVNDVKELYDQMRDFANNLPSSKVVAGVQGVVSAINPLSDLANFKKEIIARAGQVSHSYGGEVGRLTDQDIKRATGLLATPGITKEQALSRLSEMQNETANKILLNILGGQSPKQQLLNLKTYGFDPSVLNTPGTAIDIGGKKYKRFVQDQSGEWHYLNTKTKQYEDMSQ